MSNVYVYESCYPLNEYSTINTQVIQTTKVTNVELAEEIFKDSLGICWKYIGEFEDTYVAPFTVFPVFYSGNYLSEIVNIKYPDCLNCQYTSVSSCTETFFSAIRCDNLQEVYVKTCNVGPLNGTLKLLPTLGQIVGIKNPSGDDFCVILSSFTENVTTNFEINTPAWENYTCSDCPLHKIYTVNSCDGSVSGLTVYSLSSTTTLEVGQSVRVETDDVCYEIVSYDGLVVQYNAEGAGLPKIKRYFDTCEDCLINLYTR